MVSIRDVARQAGVSPATVSRILSEDQTLKVTADTRARVIDVANKLHYQPRANRRLISKAGEQKLAVALISTFDEERELNDPYFRSIRTGIELAATRWQMRIEMVFRLVDAHKDWQRLADFGAVIIIGNPTDTLMKKILAINANVVVVDDDRPIQGYDIVHNDFSAQSYRVLDFLAEKGHQKIAFVGADVALYDEAGVAVSTHIDARHRVYEAWMTTHHLPPQTYLVGWDTLKALEIVPELLAQQPTAIVAASDPIAIGLYRGLQMAGIKIPTDIAIISFDDIEVAGFLTPSLTTVHPEVEEMGKAALRLARERIVGERQLPVELTVPSTLMVRESV
ncbi:MAG TPA: LacI family DNA-binding transcriptional regulator [Lactobacillaceae bacterium]|jgi:LacI family transcriptional regulator